LEVGFRSFLLRIHRRLGRVLQGGGVGEAKPLSELEMLLTFYMGQKQTLDIVQVGANDGLGGNPINRFVSKYPKRTRLLLCEPQLEIARLLVQNFGWHPDVSVFEGGIAVGGDSSSRAEPLLWRVIPDVWERIESRYSRRNKIPSFRAASGFASSKKSHVIKHLSRYRWKTTGGKINVADAIEGLRIRWSTIRELLDLYPDFAQVDVLVIDVEGLDDKVILSAMEAHVLPPIVFFEIKHLSDEDYLFVSRRLEEHGYVLVGLGSDAIAIKTLIEENPAFGL